MIVLNPILVWIAYFAFVRGLVTLCYFSEDDAGEVRLREHDYLER